MLFVGGVGFIGFEWGGVIIVACYKGFLGGVVWSGCLGLFCGAFCCLAGYSVFFWCCFAAV